MNPFFSIVIPVYNVEKYLDQSVDSVLDQRLDVTVPIEVILVDDGSTDSSGKIADRIATEHEYIRVIHQENKGLLQARRAGYKNAKGEFVINLDSDDLLTADALMTIKDAIEKTGADILFYNISVKKDEIIEPYYRDVFTSGDGCFLSREQVIDSYFNADIPVVTSMAGKAVRRTCIEVDKNYSKYGKLSMGEDTIQTAEVISHAHSFYYLNNNLYIYRMGSGMTAKFDPLYYHTFKKILTDVVKLDGIADKNKRSAIFDEKIIATGCRAITQSKVDKSMGYQDRKRFFESIAEDSAFSDAIKRCNLKKIGIKKKYKWIVRLLSIHAYYPLHMALKIMK